MTQQLRLGVNIDHVATIRNARGGAHPDPVDAAILAESAGADGITAHLREDRRHITDADIARLRAEITKPLNLEMAATDEMLKIALRHRPHAACIVPERREERTTEGGLDVMGKRDQLRPIINALLDKGIRVSLFIEPSRSQIDAAAELGSPVVELHTGRYSHLEGDARDEELRRIVATTEHGLARGIEVHAGHGLRTDNVAPVAAIPGIAELNIGHYLIGQAVFTGLVGAIAEMRAEMERGRTGAL